jgi:hypothetical protein
MGLAGHVAYMGEAKYACSILVGKPEGKMPFARPRRRKEDNSRIDLTEVGWEVWIGFIWLRVGTGSRLL